MLERVWRRRSYNCQTMSDDVWPTFSNTLLVLFPFLWWRNSSICIGGIWNEMQDFCLSRQNALVYLPPVFNNSTKYSARKYKIFQTWSRLCTKAVWSLDWTSMLVLIPDSVAPEAGSQSLPASDWVGMSCWEKKEGLTASLRSPLYLHN